MSATPWWSRRPLSSCGSAQPPTTCPPPLIRFSPNASSASWRRWNRWRLPGPGGWRPRSGPSNENSSGSVRLMRLISAVVPLSCCAAQPLCNLAVVQLGGGARETPDGEERGRELVLHLPVHSLAASVGIHDVVI